MSAEYPATYRDKHGQVETRIRNDGRTLSMIVRGVEFEGSSFDSFEPTDWNDRARLASFTFEQASWFDKATGSCSEPRDAWLSGFTLDTQMPIAVAQNDRVESETLLIHWEYPGPNVDYGLLSLVLCVGDSRFETRAADCFETVLLALQRVLPDGMYIKACIHCALSGYSPGGSGTFGTLACFRNNKEAYRNAKGKRDIFKILPTAEWVQETYLCPEFERRVPTTGGY